MRIPFIAILSGMMLLLIACNSSNPNEKPIWAYEQSMHSDAPFQFYPDTFITRGVITVKDSLAMIQQALNNQPVDSLLSQNESTTRNLSNLLVMDLQYDMESQRQQVSQELNQLQNISQWLNNIKIRRAMYLKLSPQKPLVREVECRFSYNDPITRKRTKQDKLYYIHVETNQVFATKDIAPHDTLSTH